MTGPLNLSGPASGLIIGFTFGLILEGAGFGNPCILTTQLRFSNWSVFKVMFTAIIVCAALLYGSQVIGVRPLSSIFVPSVYFWGTLLGSVGIGAGMAIGGYCPGTSMVALWSGRLDGLLFLLGIGAGTLLFNSAYPSIHTWIYAQAGPTGLTLPQLLHLPTPVILVILLAILLAVGHFVAKRKMDTPNGVTAPP
ncbi:MAG: transporter [Acidocella sp. 20-63-7]|nr:MAG: transporter [Acidocella sp. 20-63-7]HQT45868.1 YeeE/YedE thiosulfate transporter family protein [Acidocella sp.]